jgi:hypothetical protein
MCALLVSAVGAQAAGAEVVGTTSFTCVKGAGTLHGEHCTATGTAPAEYGHVAITQGEVTELSGTSAKTNEGTTGPETTILKATVSGIGFELSTKEVSGTGTFTNKIEETTGGKKDHYIHAEGTITYSNVVVGPASQHCEIVGTGHNITTKTLTGTSLNEGDGIRIQPKTGTVFAEFEFTNCATTALNGLKTVTGSLKATTNGATLVAEHTPITTENTLKFGGNKAGLAGKLTISGRKSETTGAFTPLSATTVET